MIEEEKLKILIIEQSEENVSKVLQVLTRGGFNIEYLRVCTDEALLNGLRGSWDVVLADYDLPQLRAENVVQIISAHLPYTPFIIISSNVGEEAAEHIMALGAYDFMMISNLSRLVPAIRRGLREFSNHQCITELRSAFQKNDDLFQGITSNLPGVVFQFLLTDNQGIEFPFVSDASETLLGMSPQKLMDNPELFPELILSEDKDSYYQLMMNSAEQLSTWNWEGCIQVKGDSDIKWISLRATPRRVVSGAMLWNGIMINITRNKLAEREISRSREQLAELSSYLQKIKEQERARIAREIHDDIGGTLTAIKCELFPCIDAALREPEFYQKKAKSIDSLVDRVIDSTRRISLDLRPGILDCGIVAAVQWQAKEFSDRTGIACKVSCGRDEIDLDSDLSIAIFRIFQETLTNISKHAHATRIQVKLIELDELVLLEVIDDGCGINSVDMEKQNSFGIRGMRERCQQLKGSFHIAAEAGKGTKVTILIPKGKQSSQPETAYSTKGKLNEFSSFDLMKSKRNVFRRL